MKLAIYQVDAFASAAFQGNPAAVIPLQTWLPDSLMQAIAEENNLSETVFFVPLDDGFHIRWFTPNKEVRLCGHATLAAAYVLFEISGFPKDEIKFSSLSGDLFVSKNKKLITLDFPQDTPVACDAPGDLIKGLGIEPLQCFKNDDYLVVCESEEQLLNIQVNHEYLKKLDLRAVIVTAVSDNYDFVVRVFAPRYGILEDPVTGSAYTGLAPYWAEKLNKQKLTAKQLSFRGGEVFCEIKGERVYISGEAVQYLEGSINVNY